MRYAQARSDNSGPRSCPDELHERRYLGVPECVGATMF